MDKKTISRDGTPIAYQRFGDGPAVVLVGGAMCTGATLAPLAEALSDRFGAVTYDRRGRGGSGDTGPFAVDREVEDIAALIEASGGSAALYGISSGGALALRAVASGLPVREVAVYETPFALDDRGGKERTEYTERLTELLALDRRGTPSSCSCPGSARRRRRSPVSVCPTRGPAMEAIARPWRTTTPRSATGRCPTNASPPCPCRCCRSRATPARAGCAKRPVSSRTRRPLLLYRTLEGQTHMVDSVVLAPVLAEFFDAGDRG